MKEIELKIINKIPSLVERYTNNKIKFNYKIEVIPNIHFYKIDIKNKKLLEIVKEKIRNFKNITPSTIGAISKKYDLNNKIEYEKYEEFVDIYNKVLNSSFLRIKLDDIEIYRELILKNVVKLEDILLNKNKSTFLKI